MVHTVCDRFLGEVTSKRVSVVLFLVNGVKLQGVVEAFDDCCLVLRHGEVVQLLFRSAVSTLVPQENESGRVLCFCWDGSAGRATDS